MCGCLLRASYWGIWPTTQAGTQSTEPHQPGLSGDFENIILVFCNLDKLTSSSSLAYSQTLWYCHCYIEVMRAVILEFIQVLWGKHCFSPFKYVFCRHFVGAFFQVEEVPLYCQFAETFYCELDFVKYLSCIYKNNNIVLAGWFSWLEHHLMHQNVVGLILDQVLALIPHQGVYWRQPIDVSLISVFLSFSP